MHQAPAQLASMQQQGPSALHRMSSAPSGPRQLNGTDGGMALAVDAGTGDEEGEDKYQKRQSALQRSLQPLFPSLFAPSTSRLPITTKCVAGGARGRVAPGGGPPGGGICLGGSARAGVPRDSACPAALGGVLPARAASSLTPTPSPLGNPHRDLATGRTPSGTMSNVDSGRKRGRRRRRRWADPRNVLMAFALLCCLGTMLFVYSRTVGLRAHIGAGR